MAGHPVHDEESEEADGGQEDQGRGDDAVQQETVVAGGGVGDEAEKRGADTQVQEREVAEDAEQDLPDAVVPVSQLPDDDGAE